MTTAEHARAYLTVAEVAAELSCSKRTVRRRIRTGELPPSVSAGGALPCGCRAPRLRRGCGPAREGLPDARAGKSSPPLAPNPTDALPGLRVWP